MSPRVRSFLVLSLVVLVLVSMTGCIAGTGRYTEERHAGFWAGLFHGLISPVTLFISLFTGRIDMYEPHNVGWGYDCGFFLGIAIILGGSCGPRKVRRLVRHKKAAGRWEHLGKEIASEIEQALKERPTAASDTAAEESWQEIGRRIEEKIKRRLKDWADKD
jgi:hypothetical protein